MQIPSWRPTHRQSKWFFALSYLAAIPLFGAIYSAMPNDFYHSTVIYERSIADDERRVLSQIRVDLIDAYLSARGSLGERTREIAYHAHFVLTKLHYDNGRYIVTLHSEEAPNKDQRFFLGELAFPSGAVERDIGYLFSADDGDPEPFGPLGSYIGEATGDHRVSLSKDTLFVHVQRDTRVELEAWRRAQAGFPGASSGRFWRMLYVSAITITTVGYGDIVPLTNRARLTVAAEAVLGVVLIGLFLNSVAQSASTLRRNEGPHLRSSR